MSEEKMQTSPFECPAWFDGKKINETVFCEEFLRDYPMVTVNDAFFTVNGRVHDENRLKKVIYDRIKYYVTSGVAKKVTNLLDVMRITATPEFFKGKKRAEIKEFFNEALEFIRQNQSPETIISAVVHMDEKTPHMHLSFVPLTEDKRLSAKEIVGNKKKLTWWQDKFWEHMVKKYPVLERGESASETGRDHIPPRVFKQMTRLTKQMEKLDAMLSDVKFTNYKERTAQIAAFLEEYIPDVAAMETHMKKYQRCFTTVESEKKALKKKNDDLTVALEKSQQQSTVKKLQEARLQSDYERVKGILDRIPSEIIQAYTQRGSKKQEVNHYSGLE